MPIKEIKTIRKKLKCEGVSVRDLTPRQAEVLTYVLRCWLSGFTPTIRGIADGVGINGHGAARKHLERLRDRGYVATTEESKSSLMLTDKAMGLVI